MNHQGAPCSNCGYERSGDASMPCPECGYNPDAWLSAASHEQVTSLRSGLSLLIWGLGGAIVVVGIAVAAQRTTPGAAFALLLAPICLVLAGVTLVAGALESARRCRWLRILGAACLIAICALVALALTTGRIFGFERSIGAELYWSTDMLRFLFLYPAAAALLTWSVPARRTLADACDAVGIPRAAKLLRAGAITCAIVIFLVLVVSGLRNVLEHAMFGKILEPHTPRNYQVETILALLQTLIGGLCLVILVGSCIAAVLARQKLPQAGPRP